jgi:UDP-N-acetylmuramoyl-L-alanyl-D-glutamate--2,6-diaminopimelate ligase
MLQEMKNYYHRLKGWYWVAKCGWPARKLTVIGVTGTDGKTTTCNLIYEMLKAGGIKAGLVSTVSARIGDEELETGLHVTNPGPELLQPLLAKMRRRGITHAVLEVTSHGLDQNRVAGCNFAVGVLTNVTHEHLDYHRTMDRYRAAKAKLFRNVKWAVLNKDEPSVEYFKRAAGRARIIEYGMAGVKKVSPVLLGDYNQYNLGAAMAVGKLMGVSEETMKNVAANFAGVPGRREEIFEGQRFRVIVDFAHTSHALESILKQLREELPKNRELTVIFGCPGERDKSKRPQMGWVAAKYADRVIVTADDPRWEKMGKIFDEVTAGVEQREKVMREDDRRRAIEKAFAEAKIGDIVLLAGKGHEKSLAIEGKEIPWSDKNEAISALKSRGKNL